LYRDTSRLLPLGEIMSDRHSSPLSTAPPTPHTARPKTEVDRLCAMEQGTQDLQPSWGNLSAARPGACLAFFPNAAQVAAACYPEVHGGFLLWDSKQAPDRTAAPRNAGALGVGGERRIFPHTWVITCMAAMHREFTNGQLSAYVVTGAADGTIALTPIEARGRTGVRRAGRELSEKQEHEVVVKRLTRVRPRGDGEYAEYPATGHGLAHLGCVLTVQVLGDGRQLLSSGQDGHITIWDTSTGAIVHNYCHVTPVLSVACGFPTNKYCAFASLFPPPDVGGQGQLVGQERARAARPGAVIFINIALGTQLGEPIAAHASEVTCISMSPLATPQDGIKVASCARGDHMIKITSMDERQVIRELFVSPRNATEIPPPVCTVLYDPSGKVLASSDKAGMIRLWSPLHGTLLCQLSGHTSAVLALDFSRLGETDGILRPISRAGHKTPFAKQLVSSSIDGQVRVWHFSSFVEGDPPHEQPRPADPTGVATESTTPDSTHIRDKAGDKVEESSSTAVKVGEGVGIKLKKTARAVSKTLVFTKHVTEESQASVQRQEQEWLCEAVLQRESLIAQTIRYVCVWVWVWVWVCVWCVCVCV